MSVSNARMCTYISTILTPRTGFTIVTPHTAGYDIQQLIPRILYFSQNMQKLFFFFVCTLSLISQTNEQS